MSFLMAALTRSKSGAWTGRKGLPKDVQDDYARLYGQRWEVKWTLPAKLRPQEAKVKHAEQLAEVEARIDAIRANQRGQGQSLTQKQAHALSGEWYRWFVAQYEDNPGSAQAWADHLDVLIDLLDDYAPSDVLASHYKTTEWISEIQDDVRPLIAEEAKTDQFLTDKGHTLTNEAYRLFAVYVLDLYIRAVLLLQRRARGDYSPDDQLDQFPKFESEAKAHKDTKGLTPWKLFEAWVTARPRKPSTVERWRAVFLDLEKSFVGRLAGTITEEEAQAWAERAITPKRSARVVVDIWCNAARTVFGWAVDTKRLNSNPFKKVSKRLASLVPPKTQMREKWFRPDETKLILSASLTFTNAERAFDAARRWVPWICAYTGARAGEITQLRGRDIVNREGHWAIEITPDAGSVKTNAARTVPLHGHLLEQGFVEFVRGKGDGPLFYNDNTPLKATNSDPTNPPKARSVRTRERIAEWVRKQTGVTAKGLQPNHAWRHTFKRIADRVGISEKVSDAITGHAPASVARSYGVPSVDDMAEALKKFPRYEVG